MVGRATHPVPGDRVRQGAVVVGAVLALAGAFVGSGAAGGTPIPKAAGGVLSADATLVAPGGPAFSLWSVIYLGLVAYAIWQALPTQAARERERRIGYWILGSLLLNAAWILCVQFGQVGLSVILIVALLVVLLVAFVILRRTSAEGPIEKMVLDGTVGLYLGWVMVAAVANITSFLVAAGFDGFGWSPHVWAIGILALVAAIGSALAVWDRGRLAPAVATAWGLVWIGVARLGGEQVSAPVAVTAFAAAVLVLMVAVAARVARGSAVRASAVRASA